MLMQLVYTSRPTFEPHAPGAGKTLSRYVETLARGRITGQTHGFLVAGADWIAVALEGESHRMPRLLQAILVDSRHAHVEIADMRLVAERSFAGWGVALSARHTAALPRNGALLAFIRTEIRATHAPLRAVANH